MYDRWQPSIQRTCSLLTYVQARTLQIVQVKRKYILHTLNPRVSDPAYHCAYNVKVWWGNFPR